MAFIGVVALVLWTPLVWWLTPGELPWFLFQAAKDVGLAAMFVIGAVIASATAVGGGMVFNPTLQLAFGVTGFSALALAVLAQCGGMPSGAYGWYRKGEFGKIEPTHLRAMLIATVLCVVVMQLIFLWLASRWPVQSVLFMRLASAVVSFYVFAVVWTRIRGSVTQRTMVTADSQEAKLRIDRRIYPWLCGGAALNVATAVGIGELVTSHLIKFYAAPARTAIAVGTLLQAASVLTQAVFTVLFFREHILLNFVLIGVMFCAVGGRIAPLVLTLPAVEPYAKHLLALAALAMGATSVILVVRSFVV